MNLQQWLIDLATHQAVVVYTGIVILACFEGPILSVLLGVLLRLGYFNLPLAYVSLMMGDLIGDVAWYYIGYRYGHKFIAKYGTYFSVTEARVEKAKDIFRKHQHKVLFISKITTGFGFAIVTLVTAGMARVPFFAYLSTNIAGQFIWTGILLAIGYFFGNLYVTFNNVFGRISVTAGIIFFILIALGYRQYRKKKIEEAEKTAI